jgi:ABC-2 type transport system ATP-binding protein
VEASHAERQTTLLVRTNGPIFDAAWEVQDVSLEDIVLAYLGQQVTDNLSSPPPQAGGRNGMEVLK